VIRTEEEHLMHYGILRRSGRYPWGSGKSESTRNRSFLDTIAMLRADGMTDTEIARAYGISRNDLTAARSRASAQQRREKIQTAQRHRDDGWGYSEIGRRMGASESTVRSWLAPGALEKASANETTANMLKEAVEKAKYVFVGKGVEHQLAITENRLKVALSMLKEEGYVVHTLYVPQANLPGQFTNVQVLARPGTTEAEVKANKLKIKQIMERSDDYGRNFTSPGQPISISSRRVGIVYKDQGGAKADGMIYVRPGVPDLQIGENRYGQVRIMIDNTHYLKGMAVYKEDLPPGKDLIFNTKQDDTGRKKDAMKPLEKDASGNVDAELPFGSIVRQVEGPGGKVVSAMNLVGSPTKAGSGEAGQWDRWSRNLSSQFLSKQSPELAQQQLDLTYDRHVRELAEINSLTNPTVRKDLLLKFADSADAASAHLKTAALPRMATKVLIPVPSMKPTEVYAPTFRNGEKVALVRYPHGGTFEIPILTVNNKNREARKILGTAAEDPDHDAIGIHHKVAERLSGADFDGDTVSIIPLRGQKIESTPALKDLKGFDPMDYKLPKDDPTPRMNDSRKGKEMGKVSNLITDMTFEGASPDELARAIKHSMVVIDAVKHELDWQQSEKDRGILQLREKYQKSKQGGGQTLISRRKGQVRLDERVPRSPKRGGPIDPVTGKKVYEPTGKTFPEVKRGVPTGRMIPRQQVHRRLAVAEDAYATLPPGRIPTRMEILYADHSNRLKAMANEARKTALPIKPNPTSDSAKKVYKAEAESLTAKLRDAERNAPYERQAQLVASVVSSQKRQANPNISKEDMKKIKQQALNNARNRTGANKHKIKITQPEWDAIQAGAISNDKLKRILINSDSDSVKQLAMPRSSKPKLTSSMLRTAKGMAARGYTQAEIADRLGIGLTTLKVGLSE
jgi:DNA-binding CsgD family transcriptional regulator